MTNGYVHCHLERHFEHNGRIGISETTQWLPEKFAHVGRVLKLERLGDGWRVVAAAREDMIDHCPDVHAAGDRHKRRTGDL